jgi:beta-lactamase regulating signal transducer with metallopeptidase domain
MSLDVLLNLWMRGLLLTAALWLGLRVGPRLRAATRYWLCAVTLAVVAADTAVEWASILREPAAASSTHTARAIAFIWLRLSPGWTLVCTAIWAVGTLVMWLRMATARRRVDRFKGRTSPFPRARLDALPLFTLARRHPVRPARIRLSTDVTAASIFGGRHPVIAVAPDFAERADDADLDRVLAHAQCHLNGRDDWAEPVRRVFVSLCWFHPAAWVLSRMLRIERDAACDERVARLVEAGTGESRRRPSRLLALSHCSAIATVMLIVGVVSRMDPRVFMADPETPATLADATPLFVAPAALSAVPVVPAPMPAEAILGDGTRSVETAPPALSPPPAPSGVENLPPASSLASLVSQSVAPLADAAPLIALTAPPDAAVETPAAPAPRVFASPVVGSVPPNPSKGLASQIVHAGAATGSAVGRAGVATAGAVTAAGKGTASFIKWIGGAIAKIGG